MHPDSFKSNAPGKLIQLTEGRETCWAFVPDKLPTIVALDAELMLALSHADRALGELAGLGRTMSNPQLLIGPFIRREAVSSSRIEGTKADLKDLYVYEAGQLSFLEGKHKLAESDVKEVQNYVQAMEYGLERIKTLPMSLRLLRELHERVMKGARGEHATPGEFRRIQNYIAGRGGSTLQNAVYVPPPVPEMQQALDAFEKYLHGEDAHPPLVRLACIHYQFEAIHPFLDGNGRIGRLLISLLLVHWNLLPLPLLYLSTYFENHKQNYYDLLLGVSARGAWNEWLLFSCAVWQNNRGMRFVVQSSCKIYSRSGDGA